MRYIINVFLLNIATILVACSYSNGYSKLEKEKTSLRIMSYNVRTCRGGDSIINKDKEIRYNIISNIINNIQPSVVAIQEIDSVTQRSSNDYVLGELAKRTSMYPIFVPSIDYQGGKYGLGILSKEKPISFFKVRLPGKEEARSLLVVEFSSYIIACTHLSLNQEDRISSVSIINNTVRDMKKPVFLAGDMNSTIESIEQQKILENFEVLNDYKQNTIPTYNPQKCIDFIYGLKNGFVFDVKKRQVLFEERDASDHLPLYVDVDFYKN